MRNLFLLISFFAFFNSLAQERTLTYTYSDYNHFQQYGLVAKQRYDVAMLLSNPSLKGSKITGIKAFVASGTDFQDYSLWMASELALSNKQVVTDIAYFEVVPKEIELDGMSFGMLEISLPEPYVYDGGDIYIGYSINVPEIGTAAQKKPIIYTESFNNNGFFLHGSLAPSSWVNYTEKVGGVAAIFVELNGNFPENSLAVINLEDSVAPLGSPFNLSVNVCNTGEQDIYSLEYEYLIENKSYSGEVNLDIPISANIAQISSISLPVIPMDNLEISSVNLKINKINNVINDSPCAEGEGLILTTPYEIITKPVIEEYTGLWCGWCPRGFTAMEMLGEIYQDKVVLVCYHSGDPMMVTYNFPMYIEGYPSASVNRKEVIDPYLGSYKTNFGINIDVEDAMTKNFCDIKIKDYEISGENLNVSVETTFYKNINNSNYQLGCVLTANGLSDPDWGQTNSMAHQDPKDYENTSLEIWTTLPSIVYNLVFNDVAINTEGFTGIENSLPSEIEYGVTYINTFSLKCKDLTDLGGASIPYSLDKIVFNCFVLDKETGEILNANKYPNYKYESGIEEIVDNNAVVTEISYYDINGLKKSNPEKGFYIKITKYNNGEVKTSKIIIP